MHKAGPWDLRPVLPNEPRLHLPAAERALTQRHLLPDEGAERIGQVLLFRMRAGAVAKHLGVVSAVGNSAAFIHAYDRHGVTESPLSTPWRQRIAARFRFP